MLEQHIQPDCRNDEPQRIDHCSKEVVRRRFRGIGAAYPFAMFIPDLGEDVNSPSFNAIGELGNE